MTRSSRARRPDRFGEPEEMAGTAVFLASDGVELRDRRDGLRRRRLRHPLARRDFTRRLDRLLSRCHGEEAAHQLEPFADRAEHGLASGQSCDARARAGARAGRRRGDPRSLSARRRIAHLAGSADPGAARDAARGKTRQRGLRDGESVARSAPRSARPAWSAAIATGSCCATSFGGLGNQHACAAHRLRVVRPPSKRACSVRCRAPIARPSNSCASMRKTACRSLPRSSAS